jgi:hypothetical protein
MLLSLMSCLPTIAGVALAQRLRENPRRSLPELILGGHPPDEFAYFARHSGSAAPHAASRETLPVEAETGPVPADHGVGLHDDQELSPARPDAPEDGRHPVDDGSGRTRQKTIRKRRADGAELSPAARRREAHRSSPNSRTSPTASARGSRRAR